MHPWPAIPQEWPARNIRYFLTESGFTFAVATTAAIELCKAGLGAFDKLRLLEDDEWPAVLLEEDDRALAAAKRKLAASEAAKNKKRMLRDEHRRAELRERQRTPWPTAPLRPGRAREFEATSRRAVQEMKKMVHPPRGLAPPDDVPTLELKALRPALKALCEQATCNERSAEGELREQELYSDPHARADQLVEDWLSRGFKRVSRVGLATLWAEEMQRAQVEKRRHASSY